MHGPVFLGIDPNGERQVAIKAFPLDITPERAAQLAAAFERLVAAHLGHPSIVPLVAAGAEGSTAYLVQEYVLAESVDAAIRQYGPAPVPDALRLVGQLAGALDFAAVAGVHHGALHPRDVLVAPNDVRLTGVGVVQALEEAGVKVAPRRPYSAPERHGDAAWGIAADVFSLAAVGFELLTGRRPGSAEALAADTRVIAAPNPAALGEVFARALGDRPEDRYQTALAFAAALRHALTGEPIERPDVSPLKTPVSRRSPRERAVPEAQAPSSPEEVPVRPAPEEPARMEVAKPEPLPPAAVAAQIEEPLAAGETEPGPEREASSPTAPPPTAEPVPPADLDRETRPPIVDEAPPLARGEPEPAPPMPAADAELEFGHRLTAAAESEPEQPLPRARVEPGTWGPLPAAIEPEPLPPPTFDPPIAPAVPEADREVPSVSAASDWETDGGAQEMAGPLDEFRLTRVDETAGEEPLRHAAPPRADDLFAEQPGDEEAVPGPRELGEETATVLSPPASPRPAFEAPEAPPSPPPRGAAGLREELPVPPRVIVPPPSITLGGNRRPRFPLSSLLAMLLLGIVAGFIGGYFLGRAEPGAPGPAAAAPASEPGVATPTSTVPSGGDPTLSKSPAPIAPAPTGASAAEPAAGTAAAGSAAPETKPSPASKPPAAGPRAAAPPRAASSKAPVRPAPPAASRREDADRFEAPLSVVTRPPGALVRLDGRPVGKTPLQLSAVSAGSHLIRLELTGYLPWTAAVQVVSGTPYRVTASLERRPGGMQ